MAFRPSANVDRPDGALTLRPFASCAVGTPSPWPGRHRHLTAAHVRDTGIGEHAGRASSGARGITFQEFWNPARTPNVLRAKFAAGGIASRGRAPIVRGRAMTITVDNPRLSIFACVLGDELRRARNERGWTRRELMRHLESDISIQTVATYEAGSRQCSVARLVELCDAMGVHAHDLLARVHERAEADASDRLVLDLNRIVRDCPTELMPLRRWAQQRLAQADRGQAHAVPVDLVALESMAQLCGVATVDLIRRLRQLVRATR